MSCSLRSILSQWYARRDETEWVLCTLYKIEGSSYRKTGAMMMFSGDGAQLGLLSGGCLEGDIQRHAKQVMERKLAKTITYDATDEDDITFLLGIGCGGIVHILMQPVDQQNGYLQLDALYAAMNNQGSGTYFQLINDKPSEPQAFFEVVESVNRWSVNRQCRIVEQDSGLWLQTEIYPEPHLLVAGGGYDARAMTHMAKQLGWTVTLWDTRTANARQTYFTDVDNISRCPAQELKQFAIDNKVTAAILMCHNISLDAQVLSAIHQCSMAYIGLLGPDHRKAQVLEQAEITANDIKAPFAGPVGLRLGGDTPESIALSVLSEIHGVICGKDGQSISEML